MFLATKQFVGQKEEKKNWRLKVSQKTNHTLGAYNV